MTSIKKALLILMIVCFAMPCLYQKASALDISASWGGSTRWWWNNMALKAGSDPYTFNVATPQDQIDFRYVDLRINYCQHSTARIYFDGGIIMTETGPGGPGGCGLTGLDLNYDLGVLPLGNHTFRCTAKSTDGTNTKASCYISTPTFCGDDAIQTPNSAGVDGPANDGNEECDGTDDAVCGGLGCNANCVCNMDCTLAAVPASINSGDTSNLAWTTTNATSVAIDNGVVSTALDDNEDVSPLLTTTYTLTATNAGGDTDTCTATVTVCVPRDCSDYPGQCGAALDDGCLGLIDCSTACGAQICCDDGTGTEICQDPVCDNNNDCDDSDNCTADTCNNAGACTSSCSYSSVGCVPGDGCCLIGCVNPPDTDCAPPSSHGHYFKYDKDIVLVFTEGAEFLLKIAGGIALLIIIFGGIYYMISGASPDGQTRAKKIITYAVIGLAIVLISYIIIATVESFAV